MWTDIHCPPWKPTKFRQPPAIRGSCTTSAIWTGLTFERPRSSGAFFRSSIRMCRAPAIKLKLSSPESHWMMRMPEQSPPLRSKNNLQWWHKSHFLPVSSCSLSGIVIIIIIMQTEQHDSSLLLFTSSLHTSMSDQFQKIKGNQYYFLRIDVGLSSLGKNGRNDSWTNSKFTLT